MLTVDILIQQVADGWASVSGASTSLAFTTAQGEVCFRRVLPLVVGITVSDDLAQVMGKPVNRGGHLNGVEVLVLPSCNPSLPLEHTQQPVFMANVCSDGNSPLPPDIREDL